MPPIAVAQTPPHLFELTHRSTFEISAQIPRRAVGFGREAETANALRTEMLRANVRRSALMLQR